MKERLTFRIHPEKRKKIEDLRDRKILEDGFELTLSDVVNYLIDRGFEKEGFENE